MVLAVNSLSSAREWFEKAVTHAISHFEAQSDAELVALIPPGPVLGGMPCIGIILEIVEHTAHHRGALTAYARMNGLVPQDPYGM